jgi:DNA-binding Lrp family transcriptional regulator
METSLLPIFRTDAQARLLARIFLDQRDGGRRLSELAREAGVPVATAHREVERLERAGVIRSARSGRERRVSANRDSPFYPELDALVRKAFGPVAVLRGALEDVPGVEEAWIFGTWARRYEGEPGPAPHDIALLVVGSADVDGVYAAVRAAETQLGVGIDATILSRPEWEAETSGFVAAIRAGPRVRVVPE